MYMMYYHYSFYMLFLSLKKIIHEPFLRFLYTSILYSFCFDSPPLQSLPVSPKLSNTPLKFMFSLIVIIVLDIHKHTHTVYLLFP